MSDVTQQEPLVSDVNRRQWLSVAAGGFALSVLPVAGAPVQTSAEGLSVQDTHVVAPDGVAVPVYVAKPADAKSACPVVLVVSEIFGVHEHIRDVARRLAREGYLAVAPDLFFRQGNPLLVEQIETLMSQIVRKVPDGQVMSDLRACHAQLGAWGGDPARVAVTGFCWGGRITWLHASQGMSGLKAGVAWYGRLEGPVNELQPEHPVQRVSRLSAPVLGLYGGEDAGIPLASVERMKAALAGASPSAQESRFQVYDGAPHAFHADYRPSYRAEAAQDGWARMLAWFRRHGV